MKRAVLAAALLCGCGGGGPMVITNYRAPRPVTALVVRGCCSSDICVRQRHHLSVVPIEREALVADAPAHSFYDRPGKALFTTALVAAAADSAQTCYALAHGAHEDFLPTQHCAQVNLLLFGEVGVQELVARVFHKSGHHRLERAVRFVSIVDNAAGIVYSKQRGAL